MFKRTISVTSVLLLFICVWLSVNVSWAQQNSGSPVYAFPQERTYAHGFSPTTVTSAQATQVYNYWKSRYVETCTNGRARVRFDSPNDGQTVSEGIAYGMLLSAYHADKALFDGLWHYYKDARNGNGVMHWKRNGCSNSPAEPNGATDAEVDAAMALIIANCQWPNASTPHNYRADAVQLINAIKTHQVEAGTFVLKPGDMFGGSNCTNPSYFAPGYFRAYAQLIPADATFWNNVAAKCYDILKNVAHPSTGLVPDWCRANGQIGGGGCGVNYANNGERYHYDACRTPWRISTDYLWWGTADAKAFCDKITAWVNGPAGGINNIGDSYTVDGTKMSPWRNSPYVGGFAAGAMTSNQTNANNFATSFRNLNDDTYFNVTLRALYYLQLTGNFWFPCGETQNPPGAVSVTFTSPTTSTLITEGGNVTLSVNASTQSGSISKVEYFNGTTKIGESSTSPFSFTWNNVPAGQHTIRVVPTASNGEKGEATVAINVRKGIPSTNQAPVINGNIDGVWTSIAATEIKNVVNGTVSSANDLSATWRATWDNTALYVLVDVTDNVKMNDSGSEVYQDDGIEIYIDRGNTKSQAYGNNHFHYAFRWNDTQVHAYRNSNITGITFAQSDKNNGYIMEVRIPWSTLGYNTPPNNGTLVGFDIHVNDDDNGGARDKKIAWNAREDEAWQNPSHFGTVVLQGASSCATPGAAGNITGKNSVCNGETVNFSIAQVQNATGYNWTVPGGAQITSGNNTNSVSIRFGATGGNVSVTPTSSCGNGTAASMAVSIASVSAASVSISTPNTTICQGASVTFTATPVNGGSSPTYQWQRNGQNISNATRVTYTATNISNNDRIRVLMTSSSSCATGSPATSNELTMRVDQRPTTANAGPDQTISNNSTTLAGNTPTVGNGTWSRLSGMGNIANQSAANTNVSNLSNGDNIFRWTIRNGACPDSYDDVVIKVGNASSKTITGPDNVKAGETATFSIPNTAGTSYQWTVPDGAEIVSGQGTNTITVRFTSNSRGAVSVSETPAGGGAPVVSSKVVDIAVNIFKTRVANFELFPNPFTTEVNIRFRDHISNGDLRVLDMNGTVLYQRAVSSDLEQVVLDDSYPEGVYYIQIVTDHHAESKKVVKMK